MTFALEGVILYQPESIIGARVSGVDLSSFVKSLEAVCQSHLAAYRRPGRLDVVVAVRPSRLVRVWFVASAGLDVDANLPMLRGALEDVRGPGVQDGAVVFAMEGAVAGGAKPAIAAGAAFAPPMPPEWSQIVAAEGRTLGLDDILALAWPEGK